MKIRIGLGLSTGTPLRSPDDLSNVIDILENLQFDSLWVSDTAVGPAYDPMTTLSFAAARTERLKLGTNLVILPGRDPFLVAKQMAMIDQLSCGRLLPGFGLGSGSGADAPPFKVDSASRAELFEKNLAVIRELWRTGGSIDHLGNGTPATLDPRPTRTLEVWFGGRSATSLERVGRLGDGWIGNFETPERAASAREAIDIAARAAGRTIDEDHFGMTIYYTRNERTELAAANVVRAMQYCGCIPGGARSTQPLQDPSVARTVFPLGEDELTELIDGYVGAGLSKFVLIPADRPADWDEELNWLRAITAGLQL